MEDVELKNIKATLYIDKIQVSNLRTVTKPVCFCWSFKNILKHILTEDIKLKYALNKDREQLVTINYGGGWLKSVLIMSILHPRRREYIPTQRFNSLHRINTALKRAPRTRRISGLRLAEEGLFFYFICRFMSFIKVGKSIEQK